MIVLLGVWIYWYNLCPVCPCQGWPSTTTERLFAEAAIAVSEGEHARGLRLLRQIEYLNSSFPDSSCAGLLYRRARLYANFYSGEFRAAQHDCEVILSRAPLDDSTRSFYIYVLAALKKNVEVKVQEEILQRSPFFFELDAPYWGLLFAAYAQTFRDYAKGLRPNSPLQPAPAGGVH